MTLLRILYNNPLPHLEQRNAFLAKMFRGIEIIEVRAPENPSELFPLIGSTIEEYESHDSIMIEVDSTDRMLPTMMAVGAWMGAFQSLWDGPVPVLYPQYSGEDGKTFPSFDTEGHCTHIPEGARFVGYARLFDAKPVMREWCGDDAQ
jgi:hypothetical protein